MTHSRLIFLSLLLFSVTAYPVYRFTNMTSTIGIQDVEFLNGDSVYAATTGGLYLFDRKHNGPVLFTDSRQFPDLRLTALCLDPEKNLWIGTQQGYIYCRYRNGNHVVFTSYTTSKWDITDLAWHDGYLIVGSGKGCSVFDPRKGVALKNAVKFAGFTNPRVNRLFIYNDSLFLGCDGGVARLPVGEGKLLTGNFFDQSIWTTVASDTPIVDFYVYDQRLHPCTKPSAVFRGMLIYADSTAIGAKLTPEDTAVGDTVLHLGDCGRIVRFANEMDAICWIATSEGYMFIWDANVLFKQLPIPGMFFQIVSRIHVDKRGLLWMLSEITGETAAPWWQGIAHFNGIDWSIYNTHKLGWSTFGWMGGEKTFRGLCEDRRGRMWFGTSGGNIKIYDPSEGWSQLYIGEKDTTSIRYLPAGTNTHDIWFSSMEEARRPPIGAAPWGKSDAIAQDSSGYMWIAAWKSYQGCLIAYDPASTPDPGQSDPEKAHYRRFFPQIGEGESNWMENIVVLNVDKDNRIFAGDENGRLIIFSYGETPLRGSLQMVHNSTMYQKVWDVATDSSGRSWIVSSAGVYTIGSSSALVERIDSLPSDLTCVDVEEDGTLWFGSSGNGLLKFSPDTYQKERFTKEDGLISNTISDIHVQRSLGILWIGTEYGVSWFNLGSTRDLGSIPEPQVYPNPYSLRRHKTIPVTFKNIKPRTTIIVYTLNGTMAAKVTTTPLSQYEWAGSWKPGSTTVPGTYFFVARPSGVKGKLLIIP